MQADSTDRDAWLTYGAGGAAPAWLAGAHFAIVADDAVAVAAAAAVVGGTFGFAVHMDRRARGDCSCVMLLEPAKQSNAVSCRHVPN